MSEQEIVALLTDWAIKIAFAFAILIVGLFIAKQIGNLVEKVLNKRDVDATVSGFVKNIVYCICVAFVWISVLSQVGIQTASIVAILGAAGLAVGFALQGSLSHFASGVMLIIFRPIKAGDFVEAAGVAGVVKEITLFSTIFTTPDNKVITVPNSSITSGAIVNYSTMSERRVDFTVGVAYDADLAQTKQVLADIVAGEQRVLADKDVTIAVAELADSSVNLVVRVWVNAVDYWGVYFDVTEQIKLKLDEAGIGIPFPQMDVHVQQAN